MKFLYDVYVRGAADGAVPAEAGPLQGEDLPQMGHGAWPGVEKRTDGL